MEKFVAQFGKNFAKIQRKLETLPFLVSMLNCHLQIPAIATDIEEDQGKNDCEKFLFDRYTTKIGKATMCAD